MKIHVKTDLPSSSSFSCELSLLPCRMGEGCILASPLPMEFLGLSFTVAAGGVSVSAAAATGGGGAAFAFLW